MKTLTERDFCSQSKEQAISLALAAKIEKARKEHQEGKSLRVQKLPKNGLARYELFYWKASL